MDKALQWLVQRVNEETQNYTTLTKTDIGDMVNTVFNLDETLYTIVNDVMGNYTIKTTYDYQKSELTVANISKTNLISISEERLIEYIEMNFSREYIRESGSYIYQVIHEKAYELIVKTLDDHKDDYLYEDTDALAEAIFEQMDFEYVYDIIDNILEQPVTMEEKLADIGMSQKDFL